MKAICSSCKIEKSWQDLYVSVEPDPYYGYGHFPEIICNECYMKKDCNQCYLCKYNIKNQHIVLDYTKKDTSENITVKEYSNFPKEEKMLYHDCEDCARCFINRSWTREYHKFVLGIDDSALRLTDKKPIDWTYVMKNHNYDCHICHKHITTDDKYFIIEWSYFPKDPVMIDNDEGSTEGVPYSSVPIGTHTICYHCAVSIRELDPDFDGFKRKLYCCSKDWQTEYRKYINHKS